MPANLAQVHPELIKRMLRVLASMEGIGHPMKITDGFRSAEDEAKLFAEGRTTIGPNPDPQHPLGRTVTNCDGVHGKSNHQAHADGYGHAVDATFVVNGQPRWNDSDPWDHYGVALKMEGLLWGGDWKHPDKPHAELPDNYTQEQKAA